ncbi:MAG: tyrosine-type recombinase/integrase [Syntrophobacteraceae bacterium]
MPKITKRMVDAINPGEKEILIWDDEMPRFALRVRTSGVKTYIIQYRNEHGRTRKMTVGTHGVLTPDEARSQARLLLAKVERGEDPAEDKQAGRQAPTFSEVAERYMEEHANVKKKARSIKEDRRLLDKVILPVFGPRKLGDITRADISKFHYSLRGTPYQANRALSLLSKAFNLCEKWGLRKDGTNPCRHVEKYKEQKKERYLTPDELSRLGAVLSDTEASKEELPQAIEAIRLLILTGARLSEILTLKWDYVDLDRGEMALPDSKTGKKTVQLAGPAIEVLENISRCVGNPYVIFGEKAGQHLIGLPHIWMRIREKAGLPGVRIHDLRHSFASSAAQAGMSLPFIGALLGHRELATTNRYVHLMSDPLKVAANTVETKIAEALKRKPHKGEVVQLKKA